jgi:hypothetical protein
VIEPGNVWGIARAEMRLARRLVRFWVFTAIAALVTLVSYLNFWFIHWAFSSGSASAASALPRFFMGAFGSNFVFFVLIGLIFLGFDLRARDTRERIVEVADSQPYTNTELVLGKFLGILVPSWVAVVVIAGVLLGLAALMRPAIEPWSAVSFVLFMSIPAYTLFIGLVFLLSSLLRHRLVVALAALIVLILIWAAGRWWIPLWAFPWIDVTGGFAMPFPSDIMPKLIEGPGLVQRVGTLLIGFGFLGLATALHPRKDDGSRGVVGAVAGVLVVAGLGLCGLLALDGSRDVERRRAWKAVHERRAGEPAPDLLATEGRVVLDPGSGLSLELAVRMRPAGDAPLSEALFTLNPGLSVTQVTDGDGRALAHEHADGLLSVTLGEPLPPQQERTLRFAISGRPDPAFAYFDAGMEVWERLGQDAALLILGFESFLDDRRFVALPPGVHWLPAAGTGVDRGAPTQPPVDFQEFDLTVEVPEGWLVAGPGRRREEPGAPAGRTRFRFAPTAPLPGPALVAGRYTSRTTERGGVTLEVLVHPAHADVLEKFEDAAEEVGDWLDEKLREAADVGLAYPYDALTMVEVPNALRGYGGGWRMDSTLIQPALILMRESGFPTARFERGWRDPEQYKSREGGLPRRKRQLLESFFENDMNGGNPFLAAARSFFGFQTAGEGPAGRPLDFVLESLTSRLVTEHRGYFSYRLFDKNFGQEFQLAGQQMGNPDRVGETYTDVLIHRLTSRPEVWEATLEASLVEMDPWADPTQTIDVLALKGGAMAQSLLDDLGREQTGRLLGDLRAAHRGETYRREDLLASATSVKADLGDWLEIWLDETALPGFVVGDVQVRRIRDAEDGNPRYQSIVTVRNGEDVPGLLKVEYRTGEGFGAADRGATDPVRVEGLTAVEIGLVTSKPPTSLRIAPYLALNRDPFAVTLPTLDAEKIVEEGPFLGTRPVEWQPVVEGIVVDDLDAGFVVEEAGRRGMLRVAGQGSEEDLDQGLPVTTGLRAPRWSRMSATSAHGQYRHTMAVTRAGEGNRHVAFTAELPEAGRWELEYHFVRPTSRAAQRIAPGTWNLTLVDGTGSQQVTFDAGGGESGWNSLGTFEVADGEVKLLVSNRTDGDYVVADAIRWKPARSAADVAAR